MKAHKNAAGKETKRQRKKDGKKKPPRISPEVCPSDMTIEEWQRALRAQTARKENLAVAAPDDLCDYFVVTNPNTGRSYNVAFSGEKSPWNFCSCLDFRTNRLGTCKHIEAVAMAGNGIYAKADYPEPEYTSVYVDYPGGRKIKIRYGISHREEFEKLAEPLFTPEGELRQEAYSSGSIRSFVKRALEIDERFRFYPDALRLIDEVRDKEKRLALLEDKYKGSDFSDLLRVRLYPYQQEGVRFAFGNGRSLIADDMGLGKTIQAIGTAELLSREGYVSSVLIVCPTSLKYQWESEIRRFTGRDPLVVEGILPERRRQLNAPEPMYKIVSYHALANNLTKGDRPTPDLVIFDEVQRLKNWDTKLAHAMRHLDSEYVIALSGTPLENKLKELYAVMQLVDQYCLGPYHEFVELTTMTDDTGKVMGYKNLSIISERIKKVLLRRLKKDVALQMPERTDTNMFVGMTPEQEGIHEECQITISRILRKWQLQKFLSEADRTRLLLNLSMQRMACDSTYILDQSSRHDMKIDVALDIVADKLESGDEKIVLFSQWQRMLRLMAHELDKRNIPYSFLHGGVPSAKRGEMIRNFNSSSDCRVFLSTDAGSTGLNLQSASLLINFDLPWNPAVLEQRIARIYRLGQQLPVHIINLVAKNTIEEKMLATLSFKSRMAAGILDSGEDVVMHDTKQFKRMMDMLEGDSSDEQPEALEPEEAEILEPEEAEILEPEESVAEPAAAEGGQNDAGTPTTSPDTPSTPTSNKSQGSQATPSSPSDYRAIVDKGISALGAIAKVLQSPETTRELVDAITVTDEKTGRTTLNIPVPDKETVTNLLSALSGLLNR